MHLIGLHEPPQTSPLRFRSHTLPLTTKTHTTSTIQRLPLFPPLQAFQPAHAPDRASRARNKQAPYVLRSHLALNDKNHTKSTIQRLNSAPDLSTLPNRAYLFKADKAFTFFHSLCFFVSFFYEKIFTFKANP